MITVRSYTQLNPRRIYRKLRLREEALSQAITSDIESSTAVTLPQPRLRRRFGKSIAPPGRAPPGRMKSVPKYVRVRIGSYDACARIVGSPDAIGNAKGAWRIDQLREERVDIDQF